MDPDDAPSVDAVWRNADVDWQHWPVAQYLEENYTALHPADAAVIDHHSAYYRTLEPNSLALSLEFGAGPNLYPLMLAAGCSREIHALDPSVANVTYLNRQLVGADSQWRPFYDRCRLRNGTLPPTLSGALEKVRVLESDGLTVSPGTYDLASMHFVAESVTEAHPEFSAFCHAFVRSVRPGGHLVAAFMENMGRYQLGTGPRWPGLPIDSDVVCDLFRGCTEDLVVSRIDADPTLPDYGYTGMVLLTARRAPEV